MVEKRCRVLSEVLKKKTVARALKRPTRTYEWRSMAIDFDDMGPTMLGQEGKNDTKHEFVDSG